MTKAGRYRGFDPNGVAEREADYFGYCPVCGAYIDTRDLDQVLAHVHGAEIKISEGPDRGVSDSSRSSFARASAFRANEVRARRSVRFQI
jgi:hypothetical protein